MDDIVVEFGNARYQALMDRYVTGGEVPRSELVKVWQDTVIPHGVWDVPVYEEFFCAVRTANAAVPESRRLRVLLGDPPIDWSDVDPRRLREWNRQRDLHAAELIEQEVVRRDRKALIVYGFWHLRRADEQGVAYSGSDPDAPWLPILESRTGTRVLSIAVMKGLEAAFPVARTWPAPSIAFIRGTTLERQYDAVLYLGREEQMTSSLLPLDLLRDSSYQQMRMWRTALAVASEFDSSP